MGAVFNLMRHEHETMTRLLAEFETETRDHKRAVRIFDECKRKIIEHIEVEERDLFPIFEKFTRFGRDESIEARLQRDHAVIRKLIADTEAACATGDLRRIKYAVYHLGRAIRVHEEREYSVIYPISDKAITREEWNSLFQSRSEDESSFLE